MDLGEEAASMNYPSDTTRAIRLAVEALTERGCSAVTITSGP